MRRARRDCDVVVVSLFVNPAQFNDPARPRALPPRRERDEALAAELGVDHLFAPPRRGGLSRRLRDHGVGRRASPRRSRAPTAAAAHFDGVTTVVTKLFNMVGAGRRLLRAEGRAAGAGHPPPRARPRHAGADRGLPDRSRARRAGPVEPQRPALAGRPRPRHGASPRARRRPGRGRAPASATPPSCAPAPLAELAGRGIEPDYVELVATDTLAPVSRIDGDVLAVLAARVGDTRLIDNQLIQPSLNHDREVATPLAGANHRVKERTEVSATPRIPVPHNLDAPLPMTLPRLAEKKRLGEPIVMVTAYDYPVGPGRRGGRRRPRAGRRLGRDDRARLPLDGAGLDRRDADAGRGRRAAACRRRCWSATCRSAPTRPPTSRPSPPRSGSSRRPAATRSSSSAAAPASSAPGRSSTPGSRSWATSG